MQSVPALALVLVAACGHDDHGDDPVDCTKVSGADEFVVGLAKSGGSGRLDFAMMSADPAPPQRGDNTWIVQISDKTTGAAFESATLTVTPFMPAHQHGTPIAVEVMPGAVPGQYTMTPVNLWMPGVWETTIRASGGSTIDSAIYTFCIN